MTSVSLRGSTAAVALDGGMIEVVHLPNGRRLLRTRIDPRFAFWVGFSQDGAILTAGGQAGRTTLISTRTWRRFGPALAGHNGPILNASISLDRRVIATAGADGAVRLWDLRTRKPFGSPLPGPANRPVVARFGPNGAHLFAVYGNGRAYRWKTRPQDWNRQACAVAGRALTRAEWHDALPDRDLTPDLWPTVTRGRRLLR